MEQGKSLHSRGSSAILFLTAVGDVSFMGRNADALSATVFEEVEPVFRNSPLVVANLECPLVEAGEPVAGKCVLRGNPGWAALMADAGIHLVSLANNHLLDYGRAGLIGTMQALDRAGIRHVGAGLNEREACAPLFVASVAGRIAFLARSAVEVSSPSYATASQPGVAFFKEEETLQAIKKCREQADIIVLMIHWGVEHYQYPSPQQRGLAKRLVEAGVSIILGHHPHVLQGAEKIGHGIVAYSLGNFLFDNLSCQAIIEGKYREISITLTKENKEGMALQFFLSEAGRFDYCETLTAINDSAEVLLEDTKVRKKAFSGLCERLRVPLYNIWWKFYAVEREWNLRVSRQISFSRLVKGFYKIRPRHIIELLYSLKRSAKITSGKSTNPYE